MPGTGRGAALSDHRILAIDGDRVQLDDKDYRDGNRYQGLTRSGEELIRRFLLQVLPKGFMRIRHFGWLANRCRSRRLAEVRAAIDAPPPEEDSEDRKEPAPFDGYPCPVCRQGHLRILTVLPPKRRTGG